MNAPSHFDKRAMDYDQDAIHPRVASRLLERAEIRPGAHVLDVATGTGLLAFEAARLVGPDGLVIGVDLSDGMLAQARRKAVEANARNVAFERADAESLPFSGEPFDRILCSSALVLLPDIPRALRHWLQLLKPGGVVAFDTPAKPFGVFQTISEIAAAHGIALGVSELAETPAKCRSLLEGAGFEVLEIRTERVNSAPLTLDQAIAFYDERVDHPALRALRQASAATRAAVRSGYLQAIRAAESGGCVPNDLALNFSYGRKPA